MSNTAVFDIPKTRDFEAFFDLRNAFWFRDHEGKWISLPEGQFKRILKEVGFSDHRPKEELLSPLEVELNRIIQSRNVHYAGPLAGYKSGIYNMNGMRILVTEDPKIIEPRAGEFPTIDAILKGLFVEKGLDQRPYLYGWLKVAYETLRAGQRRPGQCLVIAGKAGSGKSLLQNLITSILGGRSARPRQFMSDGTSFNSDLFGAEHLVIEDEQASTDIRSRRNFGANLKMLLANEEQRCHPKNRPAIYLKPFWRLSVSVNDEAENLMVLPPIDESLEDKFILLRASKKSMPMPTQTREEWEAFRHKLESELPAFLNFLVNWKIPEELKDHRYGIVHFHHPEILQAIDNFAPQIRLLHLIDEKFMDRAEPWRGASVKLERMLCAPESLCRREAEKLLYYPTACGVYLKILSKKFPERIYRDKSLGNHWVIHPPENSPM